MRGFNETPDTLDTMSEAFGLLLGAWYFIETV